MRVASGGGLRPVLGSLLVGVLLGCAQGGVAGHDAGRLDSGPSDVDSGPSDVDSGPTDVDSGPTDVDSGPVGVDSGPADGGGEDAGPTPCTGASECADGVACNGVERCEAGRCVAGTAAVCDDGVACTRDRCVEPASGTTPSCEAVPDHALCAPGQSCDATGCTSTCTETPCRLVSPQCGCASGQGCYLSGTTRVCATAGSAAEGAACSGASCSPGHLCLNVASSGPAVTQCGRFCATDTDCVGAGSLCAITLGDGSGAPIPGVRVCSRSCDPITQTGCVSTAACRIGREPDGALRYFTHCSAPIGTGGQGTRCAAISECRQGFTCAGAPSKCLRYCDAVGVLAGGGCAAGERCFGFTTPIRVGTTEYGVCDAA